MFASIARRYDFLNHLLSLNIDRSWRSIHDAGCRPGAGRAGARLLHRHGRPGPGLRPRRRGPFADRRNRLLPRDARPGPCQGRKGQASGRITLIEGDTQRLPVPSDTFGVVSVAFGLRNVRDTVRGIDEMIRVARPGGKVAILEFSRPRGRLLGRLYLAFFRHLLPGSARRSPPTRTAPTTTCPGACSSFPDGQAMLDLLAARGLTELEQYPLTCGIATLYVGTKPARDGTSSPAGSRSDDAGRSIRRPLTTWSSR